MCLHQSRTNTSTLHCITLHSIELHYITVHCITLHYTTLHYHTLPYLPQVRSPGFQFGGGLHQRKRGIANKTTVTITLHYHTLPYITIHTLSYIHYHTYITKSAEGLVWLARCPMLERDQVLDESKIMQVIATRQS